jgi:hypothetical protein
MSGAARQRAARTRRRSIARISRPRAAGPTTRARSAYRDPPTALDSPRLHCQAADNSLPPDDSPPSPPHPCRALRAHAQYDGADGQGS